MCSESNRWAVELMGPAQDQEAWRLLLRAPFDPFVEQIKDDRGSYFVLRSSRFKEMKDSGSVYETGKELFAFLKTVAGKYIEHNAVFVGGVVEFLSNGQTRKNYILDPEPGEYIIKGTSVDLVTKDAKGDVVEPLPAPSKVQRWTRAASLKPEIGSALRYLAGEPGWSELYKAYEAIRNLPNGGISKNRITCFTQTANAMHRHHPNDKHKPPEPPMELGEARRLIMQWVMAAIEDVLASHPIEDDISAHRRD